MSGLSSAIADSGVWAELTDALRDLNGGNLPDESDGMGFDATSCEHAARWDPARTLAEVEVKRRILEMWEDPALVRTLPNGVRDGRDPDEIETQVAIVEVIDDIVRVLAQSYADHPDYDPAWAVTTGVGN